MKTTILNISKLATVSLARITGVVLLTLIFQSASVTAQTYCIGDSVSLNVSTPFTGTVQWQTQKPGGGLWTDIPGATTDPYVYHLQENFTYRGEIVDGNCNPIYTDEVAITVSVTTDSTVQSTSTQFGTNVLVDVDTSNGQVKLTPLGVFNTGTGVDGVFNSAGNATLAGGTYNYTSFTINSGHVITVTGSTPLQIFVTGTATINGILQLTGEDGGNGNNNIAPGVGGAGGGGGGSAGGTGGDAIPPNTSLTYHGADGTGQGAGVGGISEFVTSLDGQGGGGGSYATVGTSSFHAGGGGGIGGPTYGNVFISTLMGGSGGAGGAGDDDGGAGSSDGGGGGGGGGGAVRISANAITIGASGVIVADGGTGGSCGNGGSGGGGSGGAIFLETLTLSNSGSLSAMGGGSITDQLANSIGGFGGDGRIRLDYNSISGSGSVTPAAGWNGTPGSSTFKSPGTMTTGPISPANFCSWNTIEMDVDTSASGVSVTVDVLNGSGATVLASGVAVGTDLSGIPAVATVPTIRLRFNLATTVSTGSPVINKWRLNYYTK
jgi:hypothetical protein